MNKLKIYAFLQKQIMLMIALSLIPGLAYIALGWFSGIVYPALLWYGMMVTVSLLGWHLSQVKLTQLGKSELNKWYKKVTLFFYVIFGLWTFIFILYAGESENHLRWP